MSLKAKTLQAIFWASSAKVVGQAFSWIVTVILARLLLPADFGLIAMAWLVIGFLDLVNELGVGAAIIQKKDLDDIHLHSVFWFSLFIGFSFFILTFLVSPTISLFFNQPKLKPVLRLLSLIFIIGSFKSVSFNLLTKDLAFDKRSIAEVLSVFAGGVLSITLAFLGYGVFSLVYGAIVRHLFLTLIVFCFYPWRPLLIFSFRKVLNLMSFGVSVAGSRVLRYFHVHSATLIIGKLLGDVLLGYYSMALQIGMMPVQKITGMINQVSYPVFSKLQEDKKQLRQYFLKITRSISLITFPAMIGIVLVSEYIIKSVLTEKWMPIQIPLQSLCLLGLIKSVDQITPMLLLARGRANIFLRYNILCAIVLPSAILATCRFGIDAVAIALTLTYPFLALYLYKHGLAEINVSFGHYFQNLVPAIFSSALMSVAVVSFQMIATSFQELTSFYILVGCVVIGITSYVLCLRLLYNEVILECLEAISDFKFRRYKQDVA